MTSMSTRSRADGHTPPTATASAPRWLRATYLLDGAGSAALGLLLLVLPGWLATGLGVESAVVRSLGLVFVVNGVVNGHAARTMTRSAMVAPVAIDAVFGAVVLWVALADPSGAASWARWLVGATGLLSVDLAAVKAVGIGRVAVDRPGTAP